jgi:propionyl-CoA synthetase
MSYKDIYEAAQADPERFWMEQAEQIDWIKRPSKALFDDRAPFYEWFRDGVVNTCYNAVDRHVENGRGNQAAIIYDSPITGAKGKVTFTQLQEQTARLGGALQRQGVEKGDRVIIYMPMVPEALVAMLACARIGAIHSVVFGGFAANELATRIDDAEPKAIIAASCGIEPSRVVAYKPLLDGAIEMARHKPEFTVILQRDQSTADLTEGRDYDWNAFQTDAPLSDCVPVGGMEPVYILYTSGTTGQPKGVVRPAGGHLVALNWTMKNMPLIHGNTTVVFEGKPVGTPDAGTFWRVISEHNVKVLFTAPTAFRAIKRVDPKGEFLHEYDTSCLQSLFLAGERADPATIEWAEKHLKVPVIDHWWQTETGYAIVANPFGIEKLPVKLGSPTVPMPGYDVQILAEDGAELPAGELGAIAVKLPLPPGTLPTLWNAEDRFRKSYLATFPGYYETGDAGYKDEDGYVYIMARTDDVINVAGHRLSTGQMEEVLASHPDVAECAVIGAADDLKGQMPLGFLCLNSGVTRPADEIIADCVKLVRDKIGPVAAFKTAIVIDRLPKTRSGKVLRGIMSKIADGASYKMPATIDDPAILDEITAALRKAGYPAA